MSKETKEKIKVAAAIEKRVKERDQLWAAMQKIMDSLAATYTELVDHDLKTYTMLTEPDCLYGDSPISSAFTNEWIRQYFVKQNMDFLGGLYLDSKVDIKTPVQRATESSGWIMRFTKEPEPKKDGLTQIMEG